MKTTSKTFLLVFVSACGGSSNAAGRAPFYGTPTASDFGEKTYLINKTEELNSITESEEVRTLTDSLKDEILCSYVLGEEQLYNPYKHLGLNPKTWVLEKNVSDVDYALTPTKFSHIKVDYWKKDKVIDDNGHGQPGYLIRRYTSECYAPSAWRTRSPRIELGVHPFVQKYSDCLRSGFPDANDIDNCQDGMESIGGLTHRIRSSTVNRHRFRVSWWLKAPENFEDEVQKIRDSLKIPYRIALTMDSIYSELSATDNYRVRALAFSEETATELPRYWLIPDDGGLHREFLPLEGVTLSREDLDSRSKLKEINRAETVANFAGHFAWDRVDRVQKKSLQIPVSRFIDDQIYPLWKKLRAGENLKAQVIFRAKDSDDVFLEEFLLESSGKLTLKKVKQLNAYGASTLGLPGSDAHLDANGLEVYND